MRKHALILATALSLPAAAWAEVVAFVAMPLTPTQETTAPASSGRGSVTALYDTASKGLMYSVVFQLNPGSTVTNAHFHGPAALGANAGVAIGLPVLPTGNAGSITGLVTLTPAQEADLLAGRWYFNLHSTLAAGGELRAQLIQNAASSVLPIYVDGKLTLPVVLVPGLDKASYSAEMTLVQGAAGLTMTLTAATPLR
jgi:hypothetical protein